MLPLIETNHSPLKAKPLRNPAQFLESLREQGYKVFHDIPGEGFNIDHVLIGPAGIFTVETKTRSKSNGNARIFFDGETVRVDDQAPDPAPVIQAKAQAKWLRDLLAKSTGRNFAVKPVIVYPGWFIEDKGPKDKAVRVLDPKALAKILDHAPITLAREDAHLSAFHLSRFVRNASTQQ